MRWKSDQKRFDSLFPIVCITITSRQLSSMITNDSLHRSWNSFCLCQFFSRFILQSYTFTVAKVVDIARCPLFVPRPPTRTKSGSSLSFVVENVFMQSLFYIRFTFICAKNVHELIWSCRSEFGYATVLGQVHSRLKVVLFSQKCIWFVTQIKFYQSIY